MSATSWSTCPKCRANWNKRPDRVKEAYGKVPFEQYEQIVREAAHGPQVLEDTLREDYECYISEEGFAMHYSADCQKCDYEYSTTLRDPRAVEFS